MELIKTLRQQTGAPLNQVKKALEEEGGDLEKALAWLRKKGVDTAAKKSGRTAAEGLVSLALSADSKSAVLVETNTETDFVSRNDKFQVLVQHIANLALTLSRNSPTLTLDDLKKATLPATGRTVAESISELIGTIGENIQLRRVATLSATGNSQLFAYVHNKVSLDDAATVDTDNNLVLGSIGCAVRVTPVKEVDPSKLAQIGGQLAMHITAMSPQFAQRDEIPSEVIERERAVIVEQAKSEGKATSFLDKIVDGRLNKYFEEIVLTDQKWVYDDKQKVSAVLNSAGVRVDGFVRHKVGEGIEKAAVDFASEVKQQAALK